MLKCFIYARKSTDDDSHQIRSIDAQLTELRQFADKEGLCVVRELVRQHGTPAGQFSMP